MRGVPNTPDLDSSDREKIIAMKLRTLPDGSRRFTSEDIAEYTGFDLEQVRRIVPPSWSTQLGRPRTSEEFEIPIGPDDIIRYRSQVKRSSDKLLAALQRAAA